MGTRKVSDMVGNKTPRVAAAVEVPCEVVRPLPWGGSGGSSAMVMIDFFCIVGPKTTSA